MSQDKMPLLRLVLFFTLTLTGGATGAAATDHSGLPPFSPTQSGHQFTLHGSNTIGASLAPNLVGDYMRAKGLSNVSINRRAEENEYRVQGQRDERVFYVDIAAHGSSTAFKGLDSGEADIAMSSRPIKDKEVTRLGYLGDMRSFAAEHVIAIDGLAIIVNPSNPLTHLTIDQISAVFSGRIDNWQRLGGADARINLYARDNKSGTWDTFKNLVLRKKFSLSPRAQRFESNDQLSDKVAGDPHGIGFVGLASVRDARALAVADGDSRELLPAHHSVATEDYPLARRLFLYTQPVITNPILAEFIDFVQSGPGQRRVETVGFVAQTPMGVKPDMPRSGPEDYVTLTEGAERLSVNFRFKQGSAVLDNKARRDVLRLANYMQHPGNRDKRLLLIGFGDEKQSFSRARVLSKLRAVAVKSELHKHAVATHPIAGFGAYLPVAANNGHSRIKNRRVEVWML